MKKVLIGIVLLMAAAGAYAVTPTEPAMNMSMNMNMTMTAADEGVGMCPVLGGPASKDISYEYEGKTYYFCCAVCIDAFKADPEKYIAAMVEEKMAKEQPVEEPVAAE
jgi:YHS domain-containing protein